MQAAFRLHPDAGEAHLARAQNLYRGYLDYDGALAELEVAAKTLPNNASVFELKGYIERRQGKQEEAVRSLERAIDLDPRNSFTLQQIALSYRHLRRFAEEKSVLDRALAIEPNDIDIKLERAAVDFYWKADPRPLHQMVDSIRATNPAATQDIAEYWLLCALAERDAAAARNAVIAAGENPAFTDEAVTFSRPFMEGVIARMTKDDAEARAAFTAARAEQQKIIQAPESYGPALCVLGLIDAGLGQKEEALREGRRAVELLPVEKDPINGIAMVKYFAMIAAWVGDKDLACEQLAIAIRPPSTNYLWRIEVAAVLGPAAWRSALRKDRCLPRTEVRLKLQTSSMGVAFWARPCRYAFDQHGFSFWQVKPCVQIRQLAERKLVHAGLLLYCFRHNRPDPVKLWF